MTARELQDYALDKWRALRLGDAVAFIATPVARVIGHPCINKETGEPKPESKCAKNKKWLNGKKSDK